MSKVVVGYWDMRCFCEPIRYLLHYKNIPFEDKRYLRDGTWPKEKSSLDVDFPNLPYYFDEDVKLTQSNTILRYLAEKHGLDGRTKADKLRVSLAEQEIYDYRRFYFLFLVDAIGKDFEEFKKAYLKTVHEQVRNLSAFLGNRKFLVGDYVTYVDFMLGDFLDHLILLSKNVLDEFPSLKEYCDRIKSLPELQAYFTSPSFKRWPVYLHPDIPWGNRGEIPQ